MFNARWSDVYLGLRHFSHERAYRKLISRDRDVTHLPHIRKAGFDVRLICDNNHDVVGKNMPTFYVYLGTYAD